MAERRCEKKKKKRSDESWYWKQEVTSYDNAAVGSGTVLDQIEYTYDKFQQPLKYRQEHDGAVGAGTPEVGYTYADGSNNDKRTLSVIYPDLREIDFDYGATGSDDDLLSRFGGLEDAGGSLVKYTYFGVDTFCEQEYPENSVKLTYIGTPDSAGDPYTGLDRFGRVIDQRWHKGTTELERLKYAYTRTNNRTERKNTEGADQDEKYAYDGLYRLDDMERGTLNNGSITDKKFAQDWGYDALGNWNNFKQDDDGTGWDLNQTRDHTKANEIEEIDADSSVMSHDPAGNITKSPVPGNWGGTYDYVWDAWNRLVRIISGRSNVAIFRYNGEHKRITKTADGITRHYYYSVDWQVLEERLDEETEPLRQYVWNPNPGSMDDLILRDEGFDGSGSSSSGTQQRLYALNDLMNVTAIVDDDGNVVERYGYTPFGESRVMDAGFGPRSSSDFDWELRYKTYPLDLESGLYQVRYRYLHPGLGRWMSRDPIAYRGGLNLYGFVENDPVNQGDFMGLTGKFLGKAFDRAANRLANCGNEDCREDCHSCLQRAITISILDIEQSMARDIGVCSRLRIPVAIALCVLGVKGLHVQIMIEFGGIVDRVSDECDAKEPCECEEEPPEPELPEPEPPEPPDIV